MVRRILRVLPLTALVSCTRTVAVDSPAPFIARADRIHLRSGERVKVERIVAQTTTSVVVEADGQQRRIAIADIDAVIDRQRGVGLLQGALVTGGIGAAVGVGMGIHQANEECDIDEGEDNDNLGLALVCPIIYVALPTIYGLLGTFIGAIPGALIGLEAGHKQIYQRKPSLTIAPTSGGLRALWTIEF